ncbi:DNA polymerase interacting tetratricopeptide repeat-containing, protein of 47 kDa [Tribolium madens]|uniref:DNA polymerase interacting tetratricopeptide repeat-containing, protein of 47 kDa n=1 Tax=Tribolium madens TaxID=41895 RepID=UPI001CF7330D|nr:DNA polymerase interacting tetratricopeptide repeat-containing, protein of 47 kDa [Tribolium madens]XP_044261370.1 DNA polymerase interacting tetratricopeptide repeat-containing, protein of 47 kDa [Tribolium madens]XP_044261371.1 DNA polymerase interacting tetratricopeptide repeat-containing, protein of 47 kDa [Tribolium madens]
MSDSRAPPKSPLSEQERLELAAKLDQELDEFIDSLPKRKQEGHIPFDKWEEEITNHPFFMKEIPEEGTPMHPLYEGLQKLKYDPEENEPEELAIAYKDDGNFNFKHKKYRMAIISYTEGIRAKCGNSEIEATLYNNRSAAHFFLGNYRSALLDAETALKLKPDYDKALVRAANCCYKSGKYDKAVDYCDKILEKNKANQEVQKLRQMSLNEKKIKERDERRREMAEKKSQKEEEMIIGEILKRGINIEGRENLNLAKLEPQFPQLFNSRMTIKDGRLVWPVILFYPEYKIMDYIQEFDEGDTFFEQLSQVFETRPEWDAEGKYRVEKLNVYFEDEKRRNIPVDVSRTLLEILKLEGHVIREGTPKFIILPANSRVEKLFLASTL